MSIECRHWRVTEEKLARQYSELPMMLSSIGTWAASATPITVSKVIRLMIRSASRKYLHGRASRVPFIREFGAFPNRIWPIPRGTFLATGIRGTPRCVRRRVRLLRPGWLRPDPARQPHRERLPGRTPHGSASRRVVF